MRLHPSIRAELDKTGQPWDIERGGSHLKIKVGGRLAGILPHNGKSEDRHPRTLKNCIAQIRRIGRAA